MPPPRTTWPQFRAEAPTFAKRGTGRYGDDTPQWDSALPDESPWEAGGNLMQNGKVTFDTPQFRAAADFYISFYRDKLVPTASDFDQTQGFISGTAPMVISGPYLAAGIKSTAPQLDGKWNVALLPRNQAGTSLFAGSNMGVWAKSKHVGASLRLLDYLAQANAQLNWFKTTNELPTAKTALADPTLTSDPMVKIYTNQLQDAQLLPLLPHWDKISPTLLDSLNTIVLKRNDQTAP